MLALTTPKHSLFVTIPGVSGDGNMVVTGIAAEIDEAVDRLFEICRGNSWLMNYLSHCENCSQAYAQIFLHVREATEGRSWVKDCVSLDLCRRVLYLLFPDRFGFEKYGWIH